MRKSEGCPGWRSITSRHWSPFAPSLSCRSSANNFISRLELFSSISIFNFWPQSSKVRSKCVWQVCTAPIHSSWLIRIFCFKCPLRLQLSGSRSCNCRSTLAMRSRKPRWGEGPQVFPNCTWTLCHYVPLWMFNNPKLRFVCHEKLPTWVVLTCELQQVIAPELLPELVLFKFQSIHWCQKPLQAQRCPTNLKMPLWNLVASTKKSPNETHHSAQESVGRSSCASHLEHLQAM